MCVCLWVCAHKDAGSCRVFKEAVNLLQLELQAAESHQLWCQGPNSSPLQEQCVLSIAKLSFHHPALFLRQGISWAQGSLIRLDWLANGLQGAPCLCLFSTGITSEPPHPAYYYVFFFFLNFSSWNWSHAGAASTSLTAPLLQPLGLNIRMFEFLYSVPSCSPTLCFYNI